MTSETMPEDDFRLRQAMRCMKLAERVTDPVLAERLRALAAEFMERRTDGGEAAAKAN